MTQFIPPGGLPAATPIGTSGDTLASVVTLAKSALPAGSVGVAHGVAGLDENASLLIGSKPLLYQDSHGNICFSGLPISDPMSPGALWNNGGLLGISSGS